MSFVTYYFHWYQGQIWPNILASIICGLFVLVASHTILKLLRKQHKEHLEIQERQHREIKEALNIGDSTNAPV